jgi:iron complex outermembrane receptor protein
MYRHSTGFFGRVDLNGIGEIFNDAENTKNLKADAYELVNLALGYETELFTFTLWSKNLFDQEYYNRLNSWVGGGVIGIDGEPRSVGLTVTYRF